MKDFFIGNVKDMKVGDLFMSNKKPCKVIEIAIYQRSIGIIAENLITTKNVYLICSPTHKIK